MPTPKPMLERILPTLALGDSSPNFDSNSLALPLPMEPKMMPMKERKTVAIEKTSERIPFVSQLVLNRVLDGFGEVDGLVVDLFLGVGYIDGSAAILTEASARFNLGATV